MKRSRLFVWILPILLVACRSGLDDAGTIGQLRQVKVDVREARVEGGLEIAMDSYQRFLQEAPASALAPEAIRRLADLKVEREYGYTAGAEAEAGHRRPALTAPERAARRTAGVAPAGQLSAPEQESETDFARRATASRPGTAEAPADDLERAGALEAIALYEKLLRDHPAYERNDQVLYQMSRAYEELGRVEEAMAVMNRLVDEFPRSRYVDEVQFRRGEYFFTHRRYLDAEAAYGKIVAAGAASSFFELALYKLGWTFYKQDLHEEAMDRFVVLLDHKVATGYDFAQTADEQERKRLEDTFRVISLGFSHLGGAEAVVDYFTRRGARSYEDGVYSNLAEYYVGKRRYNDAAATYNAFVQKNPFHRASPRFHMRVIDIYTAGAFPTLVLDAKKAFATNYGLRSEYWRHFDPAAQPEVLGYLKTNLTDLANHYHALYQDPQQAEGKQENFDAAQHWYGEFLTSFPQASEAPVINYQLADLLLEHRAFAPAAAQYEKTAYDYPRHEKAGTAGYAAVYAHRQHLGAAAASAQAAVKREVVRSSLKFAATFPEHEKAPLVLGAAVDDLYELKDYEPAIAAAQQLIGSFPAAEAEIVRGAWLVVGHAAYELLRYAEAETAYLQVLALLPEADQGRGALLDNLAAAIYQQGEQANGAGDYAAAIGHFLRVGRLAPTSKVRPAAEYDAAAALLQLKEWQQAVAVLSGFRSAFPGHPLQAEVTKKLAYAYREDGRLALAAEEFERIETESTTEEVRREALLVAAELHTEAGNSDRALTVYRRYVRSFPRPLEMNLESRQKIADILQAQGAQQGYLAELQEIVTLDAGAGGARTSRTRYLAAKAALVLAEPTFEKFVTIRLDQPFDVSLRAKRDRMKTALQAFTRLLDYEIGEVTAAATFYLAEINAHFSQALLASERPQGLDAVEREEYELAIEEQAYPFEEKAIAVHESNLALMPQGIYNGWIERSLEKLAVAVPARYAKAEAASEIVTSLETFVFVSKAAPLTPAAEAIAAEPEPVAATVDSAQAAAGEKEGSDVETK